MIHQKGRDQNDVHNQKTGSHKQRSNIKKQLTVDVKASLSECTNVHCSKCSSGENESLDLTSMSFSKDEPGPSSDDADDGTKFALLILLKTSFVYPMRRIMKCLSYLEIYPSL